MTIRYVINGSVTPVPGVYASLSVSNSLPAPAPAGRSILLIGEAAEGAPGAVLDLRKNFFTDYEEVKQIYGSGPIVDAAKMIFSNQPSQVFGGAVQRLYIDKTNQSTQASKAISSPSNFGSLVAYRYGETGNMIKTQIVSGQAESKPSKTFLYLPSPATKTFAVSVNGVKTGALAVAAGGQADEFVTAMAGVTGLSTTGGTARTVNSASLVVDITSSGDLLTLTKVSGTGDFGSAAQVGDAAWIAPGLALAGTGDANAGSYVVTSWSTTAVTLKNLIHAESGAEGSAEAFDNASGVTLAVGDLLVNAPVTCTVTATTTTGTGASLEITASENSGRAAAGQLMVAGDLAEIISADTAAVASLAVTAPSAGKILVQMTNGSWSTTPAVGDMVFIGRSSLIKGGSLENVGLWLVSAASGQSLTLQSVYGLSGAAVSAVSLSGSTDDLSWVAGFASTSVKGKRIDSSAEEKVSVEATNIVTNQTLPTTAIGGTSVLELSYYNAAATAAVATISALGELTITPTGTGLSATTVKLGKYATLGQLVSYLNTIAGVSARVADPRLQSLSPVAVLDMAQSVGCLGLVSGQPAYNAKIKKDYYDWSQFFVTNFDMVSFSEGTMVNKAGLPAAEASASFLTDGAVGATSNADIQGSLDRGLKITVRMVLPTFSRDAQYDVADQLTDSASSYSIDSIHAAVKAHVSTASGVLVKRRRYGHLSIDASFDDAQLKAGSMGYERLSTTFQRVSALGSDGSVQTFLPWMAQAAFCAGRAQAVLGTSLLRKPFLLSDVTHVGQLSLYTDTLVQDFDPEDRGQLTLAIESGLLVLQAVTGTGVIMSSPDLSTRSKDNDPKAWYYERTNVQLIGDELIDAASATLENFIGERTSDAPASVITEAIKSVLRNFVTNGSILSFSVDKVTVSGNTGYARIRFTPAEALEAITLDVIAERSAA